MKLLVTGLCLSRNLGGPAMALTLKEHLTKQFPNLSFTYAIPDHAYGEEKKWAEYYGVDIVRRDNFISFLLITNRLLRFVRNCYRYLKKRPLLPDVTEQLKIHDEFMRGFEECDAVINMMGITYVGDGTLKLINGMMSYSNLYYAKNHKKPFAHFVQSFGPFNDWKIRLLAKRDFAQVDFIPARGKESAQHCRSIVNDQSKVYDFPDIAILLPKADSDWSAGYLKSIGLEKKNYTVLCPSSVIYQLPDSLNGSTGDKYIRAYYLIAKRLLNRSEKILFLPHTYSKNKHECDREICYKVYNLLLEDETVDHANSKVVREDLDVWQAKSLIAESKNAVVSRYHALVAALSTAVPAFSIGWNIKYHDLLNYYGISSMSVDIREKNPEQIADDAFMRIDEFKSNQILIDKHLENQKKVNQAFELLGSWLQKNINE